jgi:secreted trypsin-like serine protease
MRLSRPAAVTALTTALVGGTALAASAITGGTEDTANEYSGVAMIVFYQGGGLSSCSASLVSPTVLLTAGHCTDGVSGQVAVTFDPVVARQGPPPFPRAADPAAGYQGTESADYVFGTPQTHPGYSRFTDVKNWNDVGVVVLDQPVQGIEPRPIAPKDYLNQFTPNLLNKTLFRVVGYGTEVRQDAEANGNMKPTPMPFPIVRRYADSPGQKLTPQILQTNGNPNDNKGTGGSCLGDSGGPTFQDGYQVAVTSYSNTANCRYLDGLQRVDISPVQDWLATFGVQPAQPPLDVSAG